MLQKNKKTLILTSLLTLLPIPVGLLLWNKFPETMAIHWGISGQADGFASVPFAVFVPPLSMLLGHWVCILFTSLDKGNKNRNRKIQSIILWIIPVICNLSCCGIYALALGVEFSPVLWTMVPMGLMFSAIGNYMPKTKMNKTIGIKVVWAYSSEENWNATHRFAGKLWVIGGILIALGGFLPHLWAIGVLFGAIAILCIVPVVYSWRYYKKELAEGKDVKAGYSKTDKKVLKFSGVFLVVLTIFVLFILFFGEIQYEFREGNVPGLRIGGFGSFRLLMGYFENEEFGTYIRYTYYNPDACVVLTTDNKHVVLSGETLEETQALYQTLTEKVF